MTEITRQPTTLSAGASLGAIAVALLVLAPVSTTALAVAGAGAVALGAGLAASRHHVLDLGCLIAFFGVVIAGVSGAGIPVTLVGTVAVVVAWDLGGSAIDLGAQLGREAETRRLEAIHAGTSLLAGLATATAGYGLYGIAAEGQPIAAVALLLVAAVAVTIALGTRDRGESKRRRPEP